jgi:hypothetical protein
MKGYARAIRDKAICKDADFQLFFLHAGLWKIDYLKNLPKQVTINYQSILLLLLSDSFPKVL